jgi:hypothetical protein
MYIAKWKMRLGEGRTHHELCWFSLENVQGVIQLLCHCARFS